MAEPVALAALALDAAIGWPNWLHRRIGHPVGWFARVIGLCERAGNRAAWPDGVRRALGVLTMLLLLALVGGGGWWIARELSLWLGPWAWIGVAVLAFPGLAQRSLDQHVRPVGEALERGDLPGARVAVGRIVGRDTAALDSAGVSRAAIESLAESFCDGVVAPLFWLMLLGLPGIWAYKAVNTADSLIGHREPRWRAFGWAAARLDDVLNWVPARIAGLVLCLAGVRGFSTMWRDGGKHASPNAGWPEAAMAGALELRLAGPVTYDGVAHLKPWIGGGRAAANAGDIRRGLQLYRRACLILWLIAGSVAWAL